ncbi:MAG TPA: S9 family peptidase, partial [Bryobacteraceae bacterium]|nr:S9 family peptidase [Bryobacteraceae bacterium]
SLRSVWSVPLEGGEPRKLADQAERPRWSPDGKSMYFTGTQSGGSQIWRMNPDGSAPVQVTHLSTEAAGETLSPDGKYLLVTSDVYPECSTTANQFDEACNAKHAADERDSKVKARLVKGLLFRHWTAWLGNTRTHILSVSLQDGKVVDLTPGEHVVPPFSLGGPDDYAISPDSREVAFSMNVDENPAISTNSDIYVIPINGGTAQKITSGPGSDASPAYSPDGKFLAYRSQARGGYESDKWRLMVLERSSGRLTIPTDAVDRAVNSFIWAPDSKRVFFTVVDRGRQAIQFVAPEGGGVRMAVSGSDMLDDMQFTPDGKTLVFTRQSGDSPVEICKATSNGGKEVALTHLNDALLGQYQLTALEDFTATGAENTPVHGFIVKPAGFNPARKYPLLLLIHGGPEGEWGESWTYRWNAQIFAGAGYVVVMPNPRGSIGYGQKFTDEINQDWGGKPYDDLMAVTDYVAKLPYVDADRMAAAGGSYGGYMVNWMLGHTDRFKAFVSHAGVFDLRAMAEATEELWFPLWEFGAMPWDNPEIYEKWSPSKFTKEFKTPTLVIHGELDYRIVYSQALQLFTALQMHKVPSELLVYPDEGHWILKPQNSQLWYKTFIDWLDTWTTKK